MIWGARRTFASDITDGFRLRFAPPVPFASFFATFALAPLADVFAFAFAFAVASALALASLIGVGLAAAFFFFLVPAAAAAAFSFLTTPAAPQNIISSVFRPGSIS